MEKTLKETLLEALETEKQGDWDLAHSIVQNLEHPLACRIHAYLHRKEPDPGNARYWYHCAGEEMSDLSFEEEWESIYKQIKNANI